MTEAEAYIQALPDREEKIEQMFQALVKLKPGAMTPVNTKDAEMMIKYLLDCRFPKFSGLQFTNDYKFVYKY